MVFLSFFFRTGRKRMLTKLEYHSAFGFLILQTVWDLFMHSALDVWLFETQPIFQDSFKFSRYLFSLEHFFGVFLNFFYTSQTSRPTFYWFELVCISTSISLNAFWALYWFKRVQGITFIKFKIFFHLYDLHTESPGAHSLLPYEKKYEESKAL